MTPAPVRSVLIAGRDASAWLAACALSRAMAPSGIEVSIVELPSLLRPHDVYATLPPLEAFHRLIGIEEQDVLRRCAGTYTLGQSFAGFSRSRPPFFHAYGSNGARLDRVPFLQHWVKARQAGMNVAYEDFSMNAAAAKQGRFFVADEDILGFGRCDYGYHLSAAAYVHTLKTLALGLGVKVTEARHLDARVENGRIAGIVLGDGRELTADLYIDATGADSLLLGKALAVEFDSWRQWSLCDRVVTAGASRLKTLPPFGQVRAMADGYLCLAPTQQMTGITCLYNSFMVGDEEVLNNASMMTNLALHGDATISAHDPGMLRNSWVENCVAIGDAACTTEPVDSPVLHFSQLGLAFLIDLFPLTSASQPERDEYNDNLRQAFESVRDFQFAHSRLNQNLDQPYWDTARNLAPSDQLAYRIEAFSARGLLPSYDNDVFDADSWAQIFLGHGLIPRTYDPTADLTADQTIIQNFQQMLSFIRGKVEKMDTHDAFLARQLGLAAAN